MCFTLCVLIMHYTPRYVQCVHLNAMIACSVAACYGNLASYYKCASLELEHIISYLK